MSVEFNFQSCIQVSIWNSPQNKTRKGFNEDKYVITDTFMTRYNKVRYKYVITDSFITPRTNTLLYEAILLQKIS